jgi:hypothetical protein
MTSTGRKVMARSRITTWINRFIGLHSFVGDILMIATRMKGVRRVSRHAGFSFVYGATLCCWLPCSQTH